MIKVAENKKKTGKQNFDSLVVAIPADFARSHGLPERSFAALTVNNGKMTSEIIEYTDSDIREVEDFIADFPDFNAEMVAAGD